TTGNFGNQGSVNSALTGFVGGVNAPDMNTISLSNPNVNFTGSHIYLNGNVTQTPMDFAVQYVNVIAATRQCCRSGAAERIYCGGSGRSRGASAATSVRCGRKCAARTRRP